MTPTHGLYGAPIGAGWQTILADLSLILFMMTAAALANAPDGPMAPMAQAPSKTPQAPKASPQPHSQPTPRPTVAASLRAEPVGVWSDGPGVPPLAEWLAQQGSDPRLQPTILVRHVRGASRAALARAQALVEVAGPRGASARIVIEEGPANSASVLLAYDAP
jgi:hypothetical protein